MCYVSIPDWHQTDPPLLAVPNQCCAAALLCARLFHVDADGGYIAVSNFCEDSGDVYYEVHTENSVTCLG